MNEEQLLALWSRARLHVIVSQLAPTFLLAVTVTALSLGIGSNGSVAARIAAAGVLLASGILGFVAQFTAANEAQAIARDLRKVDAASAVVQPIVAAARWAWVVKFVTPAIFSVIYLAILWELFIAR